jgi:NAD(P)-dependent dehydrogenase (short-subunit alcohol dehydrogenase family)
MLRSDLLAEVGVAVAHANASAQSPAGTGAEAVQRACAALGARVSGLALGDAQLQSEEALERAVDNVLEAGGTIDLLVVDGGGLFAAGEGRDALLASMQHSWNVTRAVVNRAYLAPGRSGRIVYLAPRPNAGAHAAATCAGLENLARTLSIEWARHHITPVTVAPGDDTTDAQLATLVAYLASGAGAYFSGCLLDLRGVA